MMNKREMIDACEDVTFVVAALIVVTLMVWITMEFSLWFALLFVTYGMLSWSIFLVGYFGAITLGVYAWNIMADIRSGYESDRNNNIMLPFWAAVFGVFNRKSAQTFKLHEVKV